MKFPRPSTLHVVLPIGQTVGLAILILLLLGASYVFYISWSGWYALVLAVLTLVNFALAPRLRREAQPRRALPICPPGCLAI